MIKPKKRYRRVFNRVTGKTELLRRKEGQELLGRPLRSGEVVHHVDGDSTNNAPENLLILTSQSEGAHAE